MIGVLREEPGQESAAGGAATDAVRHPTPGRGDPARRREDRLRDAGGRPGCRAQRAWVATPTASCRRRSPTSASTPAAPSGQVRVTGRGGPRPARQRSQPTCRSAPTTGPALPGSGAGLLGLQERVDPGRRHPGARPGRFGRLRRATPSCRGEGPGAAGRRRRPGARRTTDDPVLGRRTSRWSARPTTAPGAVAAVREHRPDVVLMDIRMPEMDGIAATAALRRLDAPPQVIVLTTFQADEQVMSALRAGADGFLLKDTPPAEIVNAVRLVAAGDAMLSPSVTRTLLSHFGDAAGIRTPPRRRAATGHAHRSRARGRGRGRVRRVQRGGGRRHCS